MLTTLWRWSPDHDIRRTGVAMRYTLGVDCGPVGRKFCRKVTNPCSWHRHIRTSRLFQQLAYIITCVWRDLRFLIAVLQILSRLGYYVVKIGQLLFGVLGPENASFSGPSTPKRKKKIAILRHVGKWAPSWRDIAETGMLYFFCCCELPPAFVPRHVL